MKIFVGCSSKNEIDPKYLKENKKLLDLVLIENDLVFGACDSGIMGIAYNSALNNGSKVTGVCPEAYKDDLKSLKCDKEIVTGSVSDRTKILINESDMLLFLPGGIGTYQELFSAIESKRSHEFDKPIIIFNSNGFFNKFIEMMKQNYDEGFSKESDSSNYVIANTIEEVLSYCANEEENYKVTFYYGLNNIKESLEEVNVYPDRAMLPYFEYPLSLIEKDVEEAQKSKTDTNEFYKEQCKKLDELYFRLLSTVMICKRSFGTREQKRRVKKIMKAIKAAQAQSEENTTKKPINRILSIFKNND